MPRIRFQHEARRRLAPSHLPVAHGGRIPRVPVASSRRFTAPEAGFRGPAPEAGYRPGAPVAGFRFPAPVA